MRSCPDCGTANGETDDFCGNCGGYLGWSQEERKEERKKEEERDEPEAPQLPLTPPDLPSAPLAAMPPSLAPELPEEAQPGFLRGLLRGFQQDVPVDLPTNIQADLPTDLQADLPTNLSTGFPTDLPTDLQAGTDSRTDSPTEEEEETPKERQAPPPRPAPTTPPRPTHSPTNTVTPPPIPTRTPTSTPTPVPTPTPTLPPTPAAESQVGAVKPAKPIAQRPKVRPTAAQAEQVGPPCPSCGTPNASDRRFCRRCATPLRATAKAAPLPWWRTVWPFRRRVRSGSGQWARRTVTAVVVLGLLVGGYFLIPAGRWLYEDVRDKLAKATHITPASVEATASVPKHGPALATDGLTNTYWGAPAVGDALTFTFRSPFRLVDVVVHTGVSKKPEAHRNQARPIKADLLITASDGTTKKKTITLADKPGPQTIQTGHSDVVSVQLILTEAAGLTEGRHIALSEVEFFKRS
ncbi:NADase-type glycan-binding domain-containing protein [Streptomyces sp. NPDC013457]|uniref:NADase-type glycan-binding domain-containing protein n=1 Tax=Streptomyces sp. NPDC013457 TaxID=3364866 RepID=UPI0036F7A4AB